MSLDASLNFNTATNARGTEMPTALMFLAMVNCQLDDKERVEYRLAQFEEAMKRPEFADNEELKEFERECDALIAQQTE